MSNEAERERGGEKRGGEKTARARSSVRRASSPSGALNAHVQSRVRVTCRESKTCSDLQMRILVVVEVNVIRV